MNEKNFNGCIGCEGLRPFKMFRYCPNAFTEISKFCGNYKVSNINNLDGFKDILISRRKEQ